MEVQVTVVEKVVVVKVTVAEKVEVARVKVEVATAKVVVRDIISEVKRFLFFIGYKGKNYNDRVVYTAKKKLWSFL